MKNAFRSISAAILGLAAATSFAVTQGDAGAASSKGDIEISLTISQAIQVQNLSDIAFTLDGATVAGTDLVGQDTFCVSTLGFGAYAIEFDSATAGDNSGFALNGATETLGYEVAFTTDVDPNAVGSALQTDGTMAGTFTPKSGLACLESENNAQVFVTIPAANWEAAADSSYSDTLYITVTGQ